MSDPTSMPVTLRSVGLRIYLPGLVYGIGQGAIAGIIALQAHALGASAATAGLIVALLGIGGLLGDLPAGVLVGRIGERRAMIAAAGVMTLGATACVVAPHALLLGAGVLLIGFAGAVWMLARQAYVAETVPFELRARALSALGGVARIGMFVGPFLGAGAIKLLGLDGPFLLFIGLIVTAGITLLALPDPPGADDRGQGSIQGVLQMARESLPVLRTLGVGVVLVGAIRASRQAVIPLWGSHLDLDPATITVIFGISGAVDMLLFYPAGAVMDRRGRTWVAVPSMAVLGLSMVLMPLSTGVLTLAAVAVVMGFGNGLGSGLVMTLGADLSPPGRRAEFLGAWRLCGDLGNCSGPLALSAMISAVTLGPAIAIMGGLGWVGAGLLGYWIPRTIPGRDGRTRKPSRSRVR
ncbi:MAG TPA: MFS transporter [Actinopolymorphaceae bacterium]